MKITKIVILKFWIRRWRSISRRKAVWVAQNRGPYEAGIHAPLFRFVLVLVRCEFLKKNWVTGAMRSWDLKIFWCGSVLAPTGSGAWIADTKIFQPFLISGTQLLLTSLAPSTQWVWGYFCQYKEGSRDVNTRGCVFSGYIQKSRLFIFDRKSESPKK